MTIERRRKATPPWTDMATLLLTGATWLCMATALVGGAGAQQQRASVSARGPDLIILPTSPLQVKPEGRNALLTCRATGEGAQHVSGLRWRAPDGREVARSVSGELAKPKVYADSFQADGSLSLIFTELKTSDEGNYTCEAQYAGGEMLQRSVEIRVIKAIRWVDAPTEQWPKQGHPFKVKCKVEAEPPPSVDWTKDGAALDERYRVETDGLLIPNPGPQDDGVYTCRAIVVATGELQMRAIKVEVQEAPSFAEAERQATVNAKEDATLPCRALGRPPPNYVWIYERTGADLTKIGGRFQVDSITGDLRVSPVHADDDGVYACVARNRAGDARQRVRVQVLVAPRVALVHNATQSVGKAAELRCEARGRPPPSVEWRREGHQHRYVPGTQPDEFWISTSSQLAGTEHPDRTDGILAWNNVSRSDDGLYVCIATNKAGTAESFAHLTVQFPPSFNSTPYNQTWSWTGHIANITCLAESIPNATITWFFNDRDIEKNKEQWFKKRGEGPQSWLEVEPYYGERYGVYKCRARNVLGIAEHSITLREAKLPGALMQAVVDVITATTLKFKLLGPSNQGVPMKVYSVRYRKVDDIGSEYKVKSWPADSDYTLENLEPQTHYEFDFRATNDVGDGPWSAKVTKVMPSRSPPEPPPLLHHPAMTKHPDEPVGKSEAPFYATYPTHFELKWQIPADNGEPIERYIISWCKARETNDGHWEQDKSGRGKCQEKFIEYNQQTTVYRLQPLEADTFYMVHLYARNKIGASNPSVLLLKTPQGPGSVHPDDVPATAGEAPVLSSGALIAAVVVSLLLALLLLDLSCFACRRAGVVAALCERARGSKDAGDSGGAGAHSGRYGASIRDAGAVFVAEKLPEKTPIRSKESLRGDETSPLAPALSSSVKRDTSALFDGKTTTVGRPFIGKDSAV